MPVLMTSEQAAKRIGVAPATLAKMRVTGRGPRFLKFNARVLYDEVDVDAWLARQPRFASTSAVDEALRTGRLRSNG